MRSLRSVAILILLVGLLAMGCDRDAVEETMVPTTLPSASTTALTTTTGATTTTTTTAPTTTAVAPTTTLLGVEIAWTHVDGPLVAVSAEEAWALWAGGIGGIAHFVDEVWEGFDVKLPMPPRALAVAPDGTVWVSGRDGVFSFDGVELTKRFDGPVGAVGVSKDGTVGIGGTTGAGHGLLWVARWDGESWVRVDEAGPATRRSYPAPPLSITVLPDGEIWLKASWFGWGFDRLMRYDGTTLEEVRIWDYLDHFPGVGTEIAGAPNGDLLVGGHQDGQDLQFRVARFDGDQWTELPAHDWPSAGGASDMAVGPDGVLWFAFEGGLASVDGTEWTTRIEGPGVVAVDVAPDGTVWYADSEGVHIFH